jgi:hypothetical protein
VKRLLVSAVLAGAVASSFVAVPAAQAAVGGTCDGTVDVVCNETPCAPGDPCTITICVVWLKSKCVV